MSETLAIPRHVWQAEKYSNLSSGQYKAAKHLLKSLRLKGNEKILDIGCGDGKITAEIAQSVPTGSVLGIDISPEMIDFSKEIFPQKKYPNLHFLIRDANRLNYKKKFDIVFSSFAFQWISDKNSLIKNIYKTLKNNGLFATTIPLEVSREFEQAIANIISHPKWFHYFENFNPSWDFIGAAEWNQIITENFFSITHSAKCLQTMSFSSLDDFKEYVLLWFPYLHPLPDYLQDVFFKEVVGEYLKLMPVLDTGEVRLCFHRLEIIARKITF